MEPDWRIKKIVDTLKGVGFVDGYWMTSTLDKFPNKWYVIYPQGVGFTKANKCNITYHVNEDTFYLNNGGLTRLEVQDLESIICLYMT